MYNGLLMVQYVGIIILVLELFFIFFQSTSRIQRDMFFLFTSLLITFVAYTMEMQCTELQEALLAVKFGYLGKPFIMLAMLYLILDYCRIRLPKGLSMVLILIQTLVTVVVFTAEHHMLYYSSITFTTEGLFPHIKMGHGPFYLVYVIILILYCAAMLGICFWQLTKPRSVRESQQLKLFSVMVLIPLLSFGVFLTDVFSGYDCTLLGYLFATLGFSFSFFRLNLMDTITLAREQAVDYIHCGMLVYDSRNKLIYHNALADQLEIEGKAAALAENAEPYLFEDRIYSVEKRKIEKDNIIYGHMFFIQDMTEHYNYERRLEEEKRRADEASTAKTNFLSSMSHDIRTPMNAILGMTQIAAVHLEDKEKVADCLKKIEMSGQHLLELINSVLDLNKIESGRLDLNIEPFDMGELLEEILTMVKPLVENRHHTFITELNNIRHKAVCGDKSRLSQILMNFISNSVKYTNEGGSIWFSAYENEALTDDDGNQTSASYTFVVRDNGIGMSEDFLPHLFDPFTRAKDENVAKAQGTGLGMAITKQFVVLMGGELHVESKLGEGSTFTVKVTLRLQTQEEEEALASQTTLNDFSTIHYTSKRVLLVEDNEINAEIAGEILAMTGVSVECAADGREAVEKVASCADGYYDLIFMDIQMPVMDGYQAVRAIRAMDREYARRVPIVAMTANAFAEDVHNAKEAGMNGHIAKPLNVGQLMTILQQWL